MHEQYIYLGFQANTFFYLHVVTNTEFDSMMSGEVYNVMIHESRIRSLDDNVIIYELTPEGLFDIVIVQHAKKEKQLQFDIDNLSAFFRPLISAERNEMYVICYNYEKGCFETYETQGNVIKPLIGMMPVEDIQIREVRNIISQKQILVESNGEEYAEIDEDNELDEE